MVICVSLARMAIDSPHTRTIPAGEFKAKCLKLMDEVNETGVPIIITKRGRPVSRLVPAEPQSAGIRGLFPQLAGFWDDPSQTVVDPADVDAVVASFDPVEAAEGGQANLDAVVASFDPVEAAAGGQADQASA